MVKLITIHFCPPWIVITEKNRIELVCMFGNMVHTKSLALRNLKQKIGFVFWLFHGKSDYFAFYNCISLLERIFLHMNVVG